MATFFRWLRSLFDSRAQSVRDLRAAIAGIAASQIGTEEDAAHENRGSAIKQYQAATNLDGQGWPWCAAFVDWCLLQFFRQYPDATKIRISDRPRTASAFGLRHWAEQTGCLITRDDPEPGDIVVYTFSHCGIVESYHGPQEFTAIEGNTNTDGSRDGYEVARKTHPNHGSVLCFIRLPLL